MKDDQLDDFFQPLPDMPAGLAEKIRAQIQRDTTPVKPLVSGVVYGLLMVLALSVVAILFAALLGFKGWHVLPPNTSLEMVVVLLAFALWGAAMMARSMRPGSGSLHSMLLGTLSLIAYEILVATSLSSYSTELFVHRGVACLALGMVCAGVASLPMWLIMRNGFIVEKVHAGAVMGLVCGLAGLTALTLHCDVITVPHAGIWHAAVIIVCVGLGAVLGRLADFVRP